MHLRAQRNKQHHCGCAGNCGQAQFGLEKAAVKHGHNSLYSKNFIHLIMFISKQSACQTENNVVKQRDNSS